MPPSLLKQLLGVDFSLEQNPLQLRSLKLANQSNREHYQVFTASAAEAVLMTDLPCWQYLLTPARLLQILSIGKCYCSDWPTTDSDYREGATKN